MFTINDDFNYNLPEFIIRPPTIADIKAIVTLANLCAKAWQNDDVITIERFQTMWSSPNFNPEENARLVITKTDLIVASFFIISAPPYVNVFWRGDVHPEYTKRGIATALITWVENRASTFIPLAPKKSKVILTTSINTKNKKAEKLLTKLEFKKTRYFFDMGIEMNSLPTAPVWPQGVTIRTAIKGQDDKLVFKAIHTVFKDHWGYVDRPFEEEFKLWKHHHITHSPYYDPSLWFLAMDGDKIAGFSICPTQSMGNKNLGWVNFLGVDRAWRRQGLALALLHYTFRQYYQRGITKVGLSVDAGSLTGATDLYKKVGMKITKQHDTYEKELRSGQDLRKQSL